MQQRSEFTRLAAVCLFSIMILVYTSCTKQETKQRPQPVLEDTSLSTKVIFTDKCNITLELKADKIDTGFVGKGFFIGANHSPDAADNFLIITEHTQQAALSKKLANHFEDNTTYYARAYIEYSTGRIVYGNEVNFVIKNDNTVRSIPLVKTTAIDGVTETAATLFGIITDKRGSSVTERGFVFSSTIYNPVKENADVDIDLGTPTDNCDTVFTGHTDALKAATTYYVRAYAKNQTGIAYEEPFIFTTLGIPPPPPPNPNIKTLFFAKNMPVDTLLGNIDIGAIYFEGDVTGYLINELILPAGIDMYITITNIQGQVESNLGDLHIGDVFKITSTDTFLVRRPAEGIAHCTFNVNLRGTTSAADYYCKYTNQPSSIAQMSTIFYKYYVYHTSVEYGKCPL